MILIHFFLNSVVLVSIVTLYYSIQLTKYLNQSSLNTILYTQIKIKFHIFKAQKI